MLAPRWWAAIWAVGVIALLIFGLPAPPQPLAVVQTTVVDGLRPGGPAAPIEGVVENPNWMSMTAVELTAEVVATTDDDCPTDVFAIEDSPLAVAIAIDGGSARASWSGLSIRLLPEAAEHDACQDVAATIAYTLR